MVCLTPWRKRVHEGSDVQFQDALGPSLCVSEECDGSSSSASRQSRSPRRSRRGESVTKSALTSVPSIFRPDLNSTKSDTDTHRDTHAWVQTCGSNWGELDLDDDQLLQDHEHVDYDCVPYGPPASRSSRHLHALATRTHTHTNIQTQRLIPQSIRPRMMQSHASISPPPPWIGVLRSRWWLGLRPVLQAWLSRVHLFQRHQLRCQIWALARALRAARLCGICGLQRGVHAAPASRFSWPSWIGGNGLILKHGQQCYQQCWPARLTRLTELGRHVDVFRLYRCDLCRKGRRRRREDAQPEPQRKKGCRGLCRWHVNFRVVHAGPNPFATEDACHARSCPGKWKRRFRWASRCARQSASCAEWGKRMRSDWRAAASRETPWQCR